MVASRFLGRRKNYQRNRPESRTESAPAPNHVAIIMDGNNRWAKNNPSRGVSGHRVGAETIRKVLSVCQQRGIGFLTLFAFSSENWLRPAQEVDELMGLLKHYLRNEVQEMHGKGIRVRFIGRRDRLDDEVLELMHAAEQLTEGNDQNTLLLAIDYGGRWDITQAARQLAEAVSSGLIDAAQIGEETLGQYLALADVPPPDLCIRTGAEQRISNFLLWDLAYAELYFTDCLWPDFGEQEFAQALAAFAKRQRRYGQTSEQIEAGF